MTYANFSKLGKVPSENEKLISLTRGFERTEHESLSILVGILQGPTDLEVFISFSVILGLHHLYGLEKMNLLLRYSNSFYEFSLFISFTSFYRYWHSETTPSKKIEIYAKSQNFQNQCIKSGIYLLELEMIIIDF